MDAEAQGVVAAVPYNSDAELHRWLERFDAECKALAANGGGTTWDQFKATLDGWAEDDIPPKLVEQFVLYVEENCSAPMTTLKTIGESGEDLTQVYAEGLGWISADQRTKLDALPADWGDWSEWLPGELDDRWSDWRTSTPDVLAPWLDEVLDELAPATDGTDDTDDTDGGEPEAAHHDGPLDEAVWHDYLRQLDGDWDPAEESWEDFAARLVHYAPDGWHPTAQEMVDYVGAQDDKAATLADVYGITVATGAASPESGDFIENVLLPRLLDNPAIAALTNQQLRDLLDEAIDLRLAQTVG